ncbi:hypothetical protein BGZ54_007152 [Gamsiella multidivaricata]|nr:hypothetical protein BGZ54_007152 [Gamsiella multidivaricata]
MRTSACGTGYFHCANIGHVGSNIKTSRVNDGVCDPECCDGSDEFNGQIDCPDTCKEVGAKAKEEQERVREVQEQGSQLRKQYIAHGKSAKTKLREELEQLKAKTERLQKAASDAKDKLDKMTEKQEQFLEGTKNEREAARKVQLAPLIEEQSRRLRHAQETKDHLFRTLQNLKEKYNKNYHDLAVKNTVSGFEDFVSGLGEEPIFKEEKSAVEESNEDDIGISGDDRLKALTDDTNIVLREIGTLYDLLNGMKHEYNTEYNDEAVLAAVKVTENFEPLWNSGLQEFQDEVSLEIPDEESDDSPAAERLKEETDIARAEYDAASEEERSANDRISDINRKLEMDLGSDETFAQLLDQCFEYKDIEYTYSVCLFGDANQKSHATTFLGKFSRWEGDNYDTQIYTGGTQCWNGPERSVKLVMSCGADNQIISVSEPAKCEYLFKLKTPAVCPVLPDLIEAEMAATTLKERSGTKEHDEL